MHLLIEHSFVTTAEPAQAIQLARGFLVGRGFRNAEDSAFPPTAESPTSIHMRRGAAKPGLKLSILDQPQEIRLDYDRGRVALAATIEDPKKPGPLHTELMMALVRAMELILANGIPPEQAAERLLIIEQRIGSNPKARKRSSRTAITIAIIFVAIAVTAMMIAIISTARH